MKTTYKYIKFEKPGKFWIFDCLNRRSGAKLGEVYYYKPWKQFVFNPAASGNLVFNFTCLLDIADFVNTLNAEIPGL